MTVKELIHSKLFHDSFWTILGNALGKGLTVLGGIIIASLLGERDFWRIWTFEEYIVTDSDIFYNGLGVYIHYICGKIQTKR